jgi:uncharacterized membrane protein YraQ (UPF0718 family)
MNLILGAAIQAITDVLLSLQHNWPYLLVSILIASALKQYVDLDKTSAFLKRNSKAGVLAATAAAVATPLCSCGTTAVTLGMMAGMMPWAPIVAFMVASPLTSPEELFYSAGIFGWPFALTFFAASILLGLAGGVAAALLDKRGWLKGQTRMAALAPASSGLSARPASQCGCGSPADLIPVASLSVCGCDTAAVKLPMAALPACWCGATATIPSERARSTVALKDFLQVVLSTGKQLMKMYLGFAFIGYFLNGLIPEAWLSELFGGSGYSIPLAATLGLPFYISTEASLPMIKAFMDGGMSHGAAMAFMISGAGTSVGAIAGALTIARWRVIALVVGVLWVGAIGFGFLYSMIPALP